MAIAGRIGPWLASELPLTSGISEPSNPSYLVVPDSGFSPLALPLLSNLGVPLWFISDLGYPSHQHGTASAQLSTTAQRPGHLELEPNQHKPVAITRALSAAPIHTHFLYYTHAAASIASSVHWHWPSSRTSGVCWCSIVILSYWPEPEPGPVASHRSFSRCPCPE